MKRIYFTGTATALVCFATYSVIYAEHTSLRELDAAHWAIAQQVCPEGASLIEQYAPNIRTPISAGWIPQNLDEEARNARLDEKTAFPGWPYSPESMQIYMHGIIGTGQMMAVFISLDDDYQRHLRDPDHSYALSRQRAQDFTDFAECLSPVGTRFSSSTEPGIAEDAQRSSVRSCKNWYEYSNRFIALDISELTAETYQEVTLQMRIELCGDE